jgi:hypothetical protein
MSRELGESSAAGTSERVAAFAKGAMKRTADEFQRIAEGGVAGIRRILIEIVAAKCSRAHGREEWETQV